MKFTSIAPDSEQFAKVASQFESLNSDRFDYDALARAYNETAKGGYIQFENKAGKSSVIRADLEKRGLEKGIDFTINAAGKEGDDKTDVVFIRRETDKVATGKVREPRTPKTPVAAGDAGNADAGAAAANADAKPVKGKK